MMRSRNGVYQRYSCREYTRQVVEREQIEDIIFAGMQAPSARNERPWEFLVITSEAGKEQIAATGIQASCCRNASAVILAIADLSKIPEQSPWWIQDMSACIENMLIRATELQLGSVWLGMYPRQARVEHLQMAFALAVHEIPVAAVPIGYPAAPYDKSMRIDRELIHWEEN